MQDKISQDLKAAMLQKDVQRTSVLRSIKSAFIYAKTAPGADTSGELTDEHVMAILAKEAKKRQESADSFTQAGQPERAAEELAEKAIIEAYLPEKMSDEALKDLVDSEVKAIGATNMQMMGQVIGAVKAKAGPTADGAAIAAMVKERLSQ